MEQKTTKRVLLKDVAERAGVSLALVSFVVNGTNKERRVSDKITKRILDIAKEMNYTPNLMAKGLRQGKTFTIGVIIADISLSFFAQLSRVIEDCADKKGYTVIIGSTDEKGVKSRRLIDTMLGRGVDGFIIAPADNTQDQIDELISRNIPTVLLDRYFSDAETISICLDNFNASYSATKHLIEQGYKNIAVMGYDSSLAHFNDRINGYKKAVNESGLQEIVKLVTYWSKEEESTNHIVSMLNDKNSVDAILFTTYNLCMNGMKYIHDNSIKVPKEVALVSFDSNDAFDFFYSPLTYIKQPIHEIGTLAVEKVVEAIESHTMPGKEIIEVPHELIRRSSTDRK